MKLVDGQRQPDHIGGVAGDTAHMPLIIFGATQGVRDPHIRSAKSAARYYLVVAT